MEKVLEPAHVEWLEARKISADLARRFGLHSTVQSFPTDDGKWERAKALSVPYLVKGKVTNHKHRRTATKQHVMDKGAPLSLLNVDCLAEKSDQPVVITEGEWDWLTAIQCGWPRAVSVPNGAPNEASDDPANAKRYECLYEARRELADVERFILATDADDAGRALRADLIALLGPARCSFVDYPEGCKDLNDVLVTYGEGDVATCLNAAKPVPVQGLHRICDFPDMPDLPKTELLGVPAFDDLWGLVPGTLTIITGYPGHGKTSLVMKLLANAIGGRMDPETGEVLATPVNATMGSFETMPRPILERRILAALDERAEFDPTIWKNALARRIMDERLSVIANTPDEEHELDLETLLELAQVSVMRFGTKLLIIDPWNEIEHKRGRDENETDYVSRAIRALKRFAHRTQVAIWVVAHPRKPSSDGLPKSPPCLYDLAGCYSDDTEVLTKDGWKRHAMLTLDDKVACFDPSSSSLSYRRPERIIRKDYSGPMHRFTGYGYDLLVTPEHRMLVKPQWKEPVSSGRGRPIRWPKNEWSFCEARDLPSSRFSIPLAAPFQSEVSSTLSPMMASLAGWYVSEGCGTGSGISISQAVGDKADQIESVLNALGLAFNTRVDRPGGKGGTLPIRQFYIGIKGAREVVDWLKRECGVGSANKRVPRAVFDASREAKMSFMGTYLAGDGTPRLNGSAASTISEQLADDLQRLALELGLSASVSRRSDIWQVNICGPGRVETELRTHRNLSVEHYDGEVWCLTVPGGAYITRRNGKAVICGNSANWNNKADYGLVVHRPELTNNEIVASVVKVRMGLPGKCGSVLLRFKAEHSKYEAVLV